MAKPVRWEPKKPYSKPTFIVYGTVRDLTQKVGTEGTIRMAGQPLGKDTATSDAP